MMSDPRQNALDALNMRDQGRFHLDHIIEEWFHSDARPMTRRDRALFTALVFGVVRWRGRLDWIIQHHSRMPLKKIQPEVKNILRMALFQVFFLDRIPASAAVNTAVDLAKKAAPPWTVRFVNGLLRNAMRNRDAVPFPSAETDPLEFLSITCSFPRWLVRRWLDRFGFDETRALCDAANAIPPLTIRTNTLNISRDDLAGRLADQAGSLEFTKFAPDGLRLEALNAPIDTMPPFLDGLFQVQDEAAQLVSFLLQPLPGEKILDACAGFGGKTAHLAQLMNNSGTIMAVDLAPKKLIRLEDEMKRLGIYNVITRTCDLEIPSALAAAGSFDRILLDAPCSGLGVIRRNPDIKWDSSRRDLGRFAARQERLLQNISSYLKPHGRLVYAVCSMEPEENQEIIVSFLDRNPDFKIVTDLSFLPTGAASLIDEHGFLKTFSHCHAMDGFFAACLEKRA
jgi:16S rRNA (cytosine967-C5)-methyltransferase